MRPFTLALLVVVGVSLCATAADANDAASAPGAPHTHRQMLTLKIAGVTDWWYGTKKVESKFAIPPEPKKEEAGDKKKTAAATSDTDDTNNDDDNNDTAAASTTQRSAARNDDEELAPTLEDENQDVTSATDLDANEDNTNDDNMNPSARLGDSASRGGSGGGTGGIRGAAASPDSGGGGVAGSVGRRLLQVGADAAFRESMPPAASPLPNPMPDNNAGVNLEEEDAVADKVGSTPGGHSSLSEGQRAGASGGNGAAGVRGRR